MMPSTLFQYRLYLLLLLFAGLTLPLSVGVAGERSATPTEIFVWRLTETEQQRALSRSIDSPELKSLVTGDQFDAWNIPGEPIVPVMHRLIEVPDGMTPRLEIITHTDIDLGQAYKIDFAPIPNGVALGADGQILGGDYTPATAEVLKFQPTLTIEMIGTMAGTHYARLSFFPVGLDQSGHLRLTTEIASEIYFEPEAEIRADTRLDVQQSATPLLYIEVNESGLTALTYAELSASGLDLASTVPQNWGLYHNGQSIPMIWDGDGDSSFESNERFLFYTAPWFSRWTTSKTLYLSYSENSAGLRVQQSNRTSTETATVPLYVRTLFEEDNLYTPNCFCGQLPAGLHGDRWVWDELRYPGNESTSQVFNLTGVETSQPAELTVWMQGFTELGSELDHGVSVILNDTQLGTLRWDGKTRYSETLSIPAGLLGDNNTVSLTLGEGGGSIDGVWLDGFEVRHQRTNRQIITGQQAVLETDAGAGLIDVYSAAGTRLWGLDISDPNRPEMILAGDGSGSGLTLDTDPNAARVMLFAYDTDLISPSELRLPHQVTASQGNYIIVAPDQFHPGLAELVALRQAEGWQVALTSLEGIIDQYGHGIPSPDGIHAYLQNAYQSWSTRPEVVLLVGDGTTDPKLNQPNSKETVLPVFLVDVDPWSGEVPADNRYALLDGDDLLPDVAIGRLPVNSTDELSVVVDKILRYPNQNFSWRERIAFISDDIDDAGDFGNFANAMAAIVDGQGYSTDVLTYVEASDEVSSIQTSVANLWQDGRGHIIYTGHSTVHQWADEGFFHISQVDGLNNRFRLPVVLQLTCFTGSFHMPGLDSLDETFLRQPNAGAAGVWGSTGLGVATGHEALASGYLEQLALGSEVTVGDAILAGKLRMLTEKPQHADLVDTFTFFGDPAMVLAPPRNVSDSMYIPLAFNQ